MEPSDSFFEPPVSIFKKYYFQYWTVIGIILIAALYFYIRLQKSVIFPAEQILGMIIFTFLFGFASPIVAIIVARRVKSLLDQIYEQSISPVDLRKLDQLRNVFSLRNAVTAIITIAEFVVANVVAYGVVRSAGFLVWSPDEIFLILGGELGLFLGSVAGASGVQFFRLVFSIPNAAFHSGFRQINNKKIRSLEETISVSSMLLTGLWLIHLSGFIVLDIVTYKLSIFWLSFTSFVPLGAAASLLFRRGTVIKYLHNRDVEMVEGIIVSTSKDIEDIDAAGVDKLIKLVDLQDRVATASFDTNSSNFFTLAIASIAPIAQFAQTIFAVIGAGKL